MMPASPAGEPAASRTDAALRECPGCGLFQIEPALSPGMTARCERCGTTLRRTRQHALEHSLALAFAALILLVVMSLSTLMTVRTSGIEHHAGIFSGPVELVRRGMSGLAVVVVFVTVVAPLAKLIGTMYVLLRIREAKPPWHLRRVFAWVELLSTWSMVEVFVFGVFVAYAKLGDLVTIELDTGVYALLALTFVLVWADAALDREAIGTRSTAGGPGICRAGSWSRDACHPGRSGAKPARWSSCRTNQARTARAAGRRCMPASRKASPGPGRW